MSFDPNFIQKVKEANNIISVIEEYVAKLEKRGKYYFCLSPFTQEKTPSFCIDEQKQAFNDYSSGKSGDVVEFIKEKEQLTFPESIRFLAKRAGIHVEKDLNDQQRKKLNAEREEEQLLSNLLKSVNSLYQKAFQDLPSDHPAKKEIYEYRGYSHEVVKLFGVGYAPGNKYISQHYVNTVRELTQLRKLGIISAKDNDSLWDRITYPILDQKGRIIGIASRDISGRDNTAKWINPPKNSLYEKNKILYGLPYGLSVIQKSKSVYLVEGYNDVMSMYQAGFQNTVSISGTSISDEQIVLFKHYVTTVRVLLDGDKAGVEATNKIVPKLLNAGLFVEILQLPDKEDPDSFIRKEILALDPKCRTESLHSLCKLDDGFLYYVYHQIKGTESQKIGKCKEVIHFINQMEDANKHSTYIEVLKNSNVLKKSVISGVIKEYDQTVAKTTEGMYIYPSGINVTDVISECVEKYGLFESKNCIWVLNNDYKTFKRVSNFSIKILQHMPDEEHPTKLVRIRNVDNVEHVFDENSDFINTVDKFDKGVSDYGNYLWEGDKQELLKLRKYLYADMASGKRIEVLGWQPEGCFLFNNILVEETGEIREIDKHGITSLRADRSFYVPSANEIYKNNTNYFTAQKLVRFTSSEVSLSDFFQQLYLVHQEHAINGILFLIATLFLDIVEKFKGYFPILFLYGPPSTGKDQLIKAIMSMFGTPQQAIHIGNKISTEKAQLRKFAQFNNMIVHLSEYRPGDPKIDELLKGIWDRVGYERGNINSSYGTESIPISSSVVFTGNHYPNDEALITRVVALEFSKDRFTEEESLQYQVLEDMLRQGISHNIAELIKCRKVWIENFKSVSREVEKEISERMKLLGCPKRMIDNYAVLGAAYKLTSKSIEFPFLYADFLRQTEENCKRQMDKINSTSITMKWWNCFLACIRLSNEALLEGKEFRVDGDELVFNMTHAYNRLSSQWFTQFREAIPNKNHIMTALKREDSYKETRNAVRMDCSKSNTSAYVFDLNSMLIKDELLEVIDWKKTYNSSPTSPTY